MNHSSSLLLRVLVVCLLQHRLSHLLVVTAAEDATEKKTRPNILLILADDVGTGDIGSVYWNSSSFNNSNSNSNSNSPPPAMPHIEQLASDSVLFTDAHSTPLCATSRYLLLSGNYNHRGAYMTGVWNLAFDEAQFTPGQQSIADVLREEAGYHTAMLGKWHLGGKLPRKNEDNGGGGGTVDKKTMLRNEDLDWTKPFPGGPQDIGFDTSYVSVAGIQAPPYTFYQNGILTSNINDITSYEEDSEHERASGTSKIGFAGEGDVDWDSSAYNLKLLDETEDFLDTHESTRPDDPFFAYVALGSVHYPHSPPDYYRDGTPLAGRFENEHFAVLAEMNLIVGSLIDTLKQRNLLQDTLIIFTSDNGGLVESESIGHSTSGPLRGVKAMIYEGGHRIPMMMRWDGVFPKGATRDRLVGLNDVYATLCDAAGIDVPSGQALDSISFYDYITHGMDTDNASRDSLGVWLRTKSVGREESFRQGNMKLIRRNIPPYFELYDLDVDLFETNDLSSNEDYQTLLQEMMKNLKAIGPCANESDKAGTFYVVRKKKKKRILVDCAWFAKKRKRCKKFRKGLRQCPDTCVSSCEKDRKFEGEWWNEV